VKQKPRKRAAASHLTPALRRANAAFARAYPGEGSERQPVHTVYGGAQLFVHDTAKKLGARALRLLDENAGGPLEFAEALGVRAPEGGKAEEWARVLLDRVRAKLQREAVEDFRIDFEDGYGIRGDAEEDADARRVAHELAKGARLGTLPPFVGLRVKSLSNELAERSLRTLDLCVATLAAQAGGLVPGFVLTLPKITSVVQVAEFERALGRLERRTGLARGALRFELMVETPQSILDRQGRAALPALVAAARGRCAGAHFGTYDYTASLSITAAHQVMTHPACDFAKHVMQVSLAGTGIPLSDGATAVMPVGDRAAVRRAWRRHFEDVRASLRQGFYQGWDLHPGQLVSRYAAVFSFFLEGLAPASQRLRNFVEKAAQATLVGDVFDDAATGQGLLNYFLRGVSCGALTPEEAASTGLSLDEIRTRSFLAILKGRRGGD
jgi:citrate lyase beta subunit